MATNVCVIVYLVCVAHRAQTSLLVATVALESWQISWVFDHTPQMGLQLWLITILYHR